MSRLDPTRLLILIISSGLLLFVLFGDDIYHAARRWLNRARAQAPGWFTWRSGVPLVIAGLLAILMRIPSISLFLVLIGAYYMWRAYERARLAELSKLTREIEQLVFSFRNVYRLQPVVYNALKEAMRRLEEPLKGWIDTALQAYLVTSDNEEIFRVLRSKSTNHYLNQFIYILEMSGAASEGRVVGALENLSARLRSRDSLQRETEVELGSVTSQTTMINMIGIAVLFLIALVPNLRGVYARSASLQMVYIIMLSIALFASRYIDRKVDALRERAL